MTDPSLDDQRRQDTLAIAYRALASDLLRDARPADEDIGLLALAVTDAVSAGDCELLAVVPSVLSRLLRCVPDASWSAEWIGRLRTLESVTRFGAVLLERERRDAD